MSVLALKYLNYMIELSNGGYPSFILSLILETSKGIDKNFKKAFITQELSAAQ
jgi:hypothetical protein